MSAVTVRPAEGRLVPQEDGRDWPRDAKGDLAWLTIEPTRYIRRRLTDGDLVVRPAPTPKPGKE